MENRIVVMAGGTCGSSVSPVRELGSVLTTSFGVVLNNVGIVVDNGYGVQNVTNFLRGQNVQKVAICQTHLHTDHIAGLSVNNLLFDKFINNLGVWSPDLDHESKKFGDVWEEAFNKSNWPVRPEDFGIRPLFHQFQIGGESLPRYFSTMRLYHPGGSVAYRFHHPHGDIVIATDHEPGRDEKVDKKYAEFVSGANLLVADIQYRQSEYNGDVGISGGPAMSRKDWGHATPESLAAVIKKCAVPPKLIWMTHHDPMRLGPDLRKLLSETYDTFEGICPVRLATDGSILLT